MTATEMGSNQDIMHAHKAAFGSTPWVSLPPEMMLMRINYYCAAIRANVGAKARPAIVR